MKTFFDEDDELQEQWPGNDDADLDNDADTDNDYMTRVGINDDPDDYDIDEDTGLESDDSRDGDSDLFDDDETGTRRNSLDDPGNDLVGGPGDNDDEDDGL